MKIPHERLAIQAFLSTPVRPSAGVDRGGAEPADVPNTAAGGTAPVTIRSDHFAGRLHLG
jgi:hypothetical protein